MMKYKRNIIPLTTTKKELEKGKNMTRERKRENTEMGTTAARWKRWKRFPSLVRSSATSASASSAPPAGTTRPAAHLAARR